MHLRLLDWERMFPHEWQVHTSAWGGRSALCGSDLADAYVFTGVHVFGTAPVCIWHCVSVALKSVHSHVCLPVLVSLHVVHTCAHYCK